MNLLLRTRELVLNEEGCRTWQAAETPKTVDPAQTALVVVDMWNRHWSTGATRRCAALAPKINQTVAAARKAGALIIHAPSDCMPFYAEHPARLRALSLPAMELPQRVALHEPPQPVDSSDGGSDTEDEFPPNTGVWFRQTEAIAIDPACDLISDDGREVYAHLAARGVTLVIFLGVHTNMCVLGRSFAIKAMRRAGLQTALVRDLTDAMYNPAMPPYVSHGEGTRLVVEYIEKFLSPTITSSQLLALEE
jgi:nicotinamidase-related amidase